MTTCMPSIVPKLSLTIMLMFIGMQLFCQTREIKTLNYQDHSIDYSRIDYSHFGTIQFFITFYSTSSELDNLEQEAYTCLLDVDRLYHTVYFFVRIPDSKRLDQKEFITDFMMFLKETENLPNVHFYLNFDQMRLSQDTITHLKETSNLKKTIHGISTENICNYLSIR